MVTRSPRQYPHTLQVTIAANSTIDTNGDPVSGTTSGLTYSCRAEKMGRTGRGGIVNTKDGQEIRYAWVLYMPLPVVKIPVGAKVQVYDGVELIADGNVKTAFRGQLNAEVYL